MTTFDNIGLAEPSTITKVVASVVIARGSTNEHQEILCIGDPQSSLGVAAVLGAAPASTVLGLAVRIVSGPSSAGDYVTQIQGNSTVVQGTSPWVVGFQAGNISSVAQTGNSSGLTVRPVWSSSGVDQPVRALLSSTSADNPVTVSGNSTSHFEKASTSARSSITQSSTSVTLQAANASRLGWSCFNNPTQNANLYIKHGAATASTADFDVRIGPFQYYEMPLPVTTELIVGVWDSTGVGFARVREVLP